MMLRLFLFYSALGVSALAPTHVTVKRHLSSVEETTQVLDSLLLPLEEKTQRLIVAGEIQGSLLVASQQTDSNLTYGEFPVASFYSLVQRALQYIRPKKKDDSLTLVDLGSGCGRLVLAAGLLSNDFDCIHGIEISEPLHQQALQAVQRGVQHGYLSSTEDSTASSIALHSASAFDCASILQQADVVFSYSTAMDTSRFDPMVGAMIIKGDDWNEMPCKGVVITTDRALDPDYGWTLLDRVEVDNPEVMGSTAYIQVRQ